MRIIKDPLGIFVAICNRRRFNITEESLLEYFCDGTTAGDSNIPYFPTIFGRLNRKMVQVCLKADLPKFITDAYVHLGPPL